MEIQLHTNMLQVCLTTSAQHKEQAAAGLTTNTSIKPEDVSVHRKTFLCYCLLGFNTQQVEVQQLRRLYYALHSLHFEEKLIMVIKSCWK